jgi:hypothetical protein
MTFKKNALSLAVLAVSSLTATAPDRAEAGLVVAYTDRSAFLADLPGGTPVTTLDFESHAAGTPVTSLGGITFSFWNPWGDGLMVSSGFGTTSGTRYLGTDFDDNENQIEAGDEIDFSFASGVSAVGLSIISGDALWPGDLWLETTYNGQEWQVSNETTFTPLSDGNAYFLGLRTSNGGALSAVRLRSNPAADEAFFFNVDAITTSGAQVVAVPEPSPFILAGTAGLMGLGYAWRRRKARTSSQMS